MPYQNEHAARMQPPDKYQEFRRENDKFGPGIHAIWGILKGGGTELQAVRFDKSKFTTEEAKKWLEDHKMNPMMFEPAMEGDTMMRSDIQNDKETHGFIHAGEFRVSTPSTPDSPTVISGYAAVFNKLSKPIRTERRIWRERIVPGAFTRSLSGQDDIWALVEHDEKRKLARRINGSLKLSQDNTGLAVEVSTPNTSTGKEALEEIRAGLISGWSFAFNVRPTASDQSWYRTEEDGWMREIRALDLFEVTLTGSPAYPDANVIELRSGCAAEKYLEDWEKECQKKSQEAALSEAKARARKLFLMRQP